MQITIDTRHDDYATALAVLRRAYGRTSQRPGGQRDAKDAKQDPAPERAEESAPIATGASRSSKRSAGSAAPTKRKTSRTTKSTAKRSTKGKRTVERLSDSATAATASGTAANVAPPGMSELIRAWALEEGITVSDRGRLPAHVITAYRDAHPQPAQ